MKAKEKQELRDLIMESVSELEFGGFEYKGLTKEGAAFSNGIDVVTLKATVKNEGFDLEGALTGQPTKTTSTAKVDKVLDILMEEI